VNALALSFEGMPVRSHVDGQGVPWFVAGDVCAVLGIVNVGNVLASLDEDERDDIRTVDVVGREARVATINESGLYSLILRSRKPEARRFKRWVTHEVLPQIRRTGGYGSGADVLAQLARLEGALAELRVSRRPALPRPDEARPFTLPIHNDTIDELVRRWAVERTGTPAGKATELRLDFERWAGRAVTATAFGRCLGRLGAGRYKRNGAVWDLAPLREPDQASTIVGRGGPSW